MCWQATASCSANEREVPFCEPYRIRTRPVSVEEEEAACVGKGGDGYLCLGGDEQDPSPYTWVRMSAGEMRY